MNKPKKIEIYDIDYDNAMDFIKKLIRKTKDEEEFLRNISHYFGGSHVYFEKYDKQSRDEFILYLYENKYKTLSISKNECYKRINHETKTYLFSQNINYKVTERIVRHVIEAKRCI